MEQIVYQKIYSAHFPIINILLYYFHCIKNNIFYYFRHTHTHKKQNVLRHKRMCKKLPASLWSHTAISMQHISQWKDKINGNSHRKAQNCAIHLCLHVLPIMFEYKFRIMNKIKLLIFFSFVFFYKAKTNCDEVKLFFLLPLQIPAIDYKDRFVSLHIFTP